MSDEIQKLTKHPGHPDQKVHAGKVQELGATVTQATQQSKEPTVREAGANRVQRIKRLLAAMQSGNQAEGNAAWNSLPEADRVRLGEMKSHFQKGMPMSNLRNQLEQLLKEWNPKQPRVPAGSSAGGQFASTGGNSMSGVNELGQRQMDAARTKDERETKLERDRQKIGAALDSAPSPNDLKARGPAGTNPKGYDVNADTREPSLAGARHFIADVRDGLPDIISAAASTTGKGDLETPRGVDYINKPDFAGKLREHILGLGIDPESISDFNELVNEVVDWKHNLKVGENDSDWNDGDDLVWADDQDPAEIGQKIEEYIEVGLEDNNGPTFDKPTGRFGIVVNWGESGGEYHATLNRVTERPKTGDEVFVYHHGVYSPAKFLNTMAGPGGNLHLRMPTGQSVHAYQDQLYTKVKSPDRPKLQTPSEVRASMAAALKRK